MIATTGTAMRTGKTRSEGSWALSILAGLGAIVCLGLTGVILAFFGGSLGATEAGKVLLGVSSIVVHLVGFVVMGLFAGHFAREWRKQWLGLLIVVPLMVSAAGYTITSIMGFVASERIAVAKAREKAEADVVAAKKAAEQAARERREAQERLAKSQLGFMQAEIKDAKRGDKRVLSKNFASGAAQIIAEVGKDSPAEAPASGGQIALRPDEQAEQIANLTGSSVSVVQLTMMAWLAVLLVSLELVLWPLCSWARPRRVAMIELEAQSSPPDQTPAAVQSPEATAAQLPSQPLPALPAPSEQAQPAPDAAAEALAGEGCPDPLPPGTPEPPRRTPPAALPATVQTPRQAAEAFWLWCHRTGRNGVGYVDETLKEAYEAFLIGENVAPVPIDSFKAALRSLGRKRVRDERKNIGGQKRIVWMIIGSRPAELKKAQTPEPAKEERRSAEIHHLPLSQAVADDRGGAGYGPHAHHRPELVRVDKLAWQQVNGRSRKQRGSRCGRTARAA